MTEQQAPLQIPCVDQFDPEVRCAALRLLANAPSAEYLPGVADDTVMHKGAQLSEILQFLARFGYEALGQISGQNDSFATGFIRDEFETAEFAQLCDHFEAELEAEGLA